MDRYILKIGRVQIKQEGLFEDLIFLNRYLGTLANNSDQDEMPHNAAFHQGLDRLLRKN